MAKQYYNYTTPRIRREMKPEKRHNQSIDVWQQSIHQAIIVSNYQITRPTERYIADVLNHHMRDGALTKTPIDIAWLEPVRSEKDAVIKYQQIGNKCLIICSFFPQQADHYNTDISHYHQVGQSAFHFVANQKKATTEHELFNELSEQFIVITNILKNIKIDPILKK